MAREDGGGGFGWGIFVGGLLGFAAGAYLASGPGREQVDNIRMRTIELSNRTELPQRAREATEKARAAVKDPEHPLNRAVRDGVSAARRRREELEREAAAGEAGPAPREG